MTQDSYQFVLTNWHLFGLICILFLISLLPTDRISRKRAIVTEFSFVWAVTLCYTLIRSLERNEHHVAVGNSRSIIAVEKRMGIFHENWLQQHVMTRDHLVQFANMVYVWWHWPVIVTVLVWMFVRCPDEYSIYRNAMLISGGIGLVIFAVFPAAPPRFMPGTGLTDTVTDRAIFNNILLPPSLANLYAAMPSLHVGWNLIVAIALVRHATNVLIRVFGVIMPVAMFFAIVATGNHYILDGIAGDAIAVAAIAGALALQRRRAPAQVQAEAEAGAAEPAGRLVPF